MPLEDLRIVINAIFHEPKKVDLHGFGEPTLDPDLLEKIRLVRLQWPSAEIRIYSTLGQEVPPDYFRRLFDAGLSTLEVSYYGIDREEYRLIHGSNTHHIATTNLYRAINASPKSVVLRLMPTNPRTDSKYNLKTQREKLHQLARSSGVKLVQERAMHNWGSARKFNSPGDQICSVVNGYRSRVLQVTWDLKVIPCCFDFNSSITLGNLRYQSISEIFQSPVYKSFIRAHESGELDAYPACQGCEKCLLK